MLAVPPAQNHTAILFIHSLDDLLISFLSQLKH